MKEEEYSGICGAQPTLGVIMRNLNKCPTHIKAVAYTSLVRPVLEYASAAWDPHSQNNIKTLDKIQRQAARFCTKFFLFQGTRICNKTFTRTRIARRKHKIITTLYKMEHNITDISLDQYVIHLGLPVAHVNITSRYFKLDTGPTHSENSIFELG